MTADLRDQLQAALGTAFSIERELGGGGMSRVFVATETALGRRVVVKVLPAELGTDLSAERFRREVQLTAQLHHPHVVPVLSAGAADGLLYYTMPYVEGESLRDRLRRERQLPVEDAVRIAREAADALDYAHARGVLHRDVKPENILLAAGHAVVADFGIARAVSRAAGAETLTGTGLTLGTPAYMSPEQASGERDIDTRSDIYSLGCVLYEMLAGEPPFTGPTAQAVIAKRFAIPPPRIRVVRPGVPESVERALLKALATVAADRFATAAEFARALARGVEQDGRIPDRGARRLLQRRLALVGLVGLLVAGGVALALRLATVSTAPSSARRMLAVLPFEYTGRSEEAYVADGLVEELISALGTLQGLQVASQTSSFALKGKHISLRAVAETLGVSAVVEGAVRTVGDRIRVSARLVDARDGSALWSNTYDRELKDVFDVQEEIARAIAQALKLRLAGDRVSGAERLARGATSDVDAYRLYLKGRQAWNRRSREGFEHALELFQQAIDRDPTFALAYAGLADTYALLGGATYQFIAPEEAAPRAKEAARRALQLDSTLAEAHATLAFVATVYEWDWAEAERRFQLAISLNPSYATAYQYYSRYLAGMGRHDDALKAATKATELDPLSMVVRGNAASMFYYARQYDRALAEFRKALAAGPPFPRMRVEMAQTMIADGQYDAAISELKRAPDSYGGLVDGLLGYAYAARRDVTGARQALDALERRSRGEYVSPVFAAWVHGRLGERDKAFRLLDRAYAERSPSMRFLKVDPLLDPLRSDPRFSSLLRRMRIEP